MTVLILDAQPHGLTGCPADARPAGEVTAAAFSAAIECEFRGDAAAAAQQRHAVKADVNARIDAGLRGLEAEPTQARARRVRQPAACSRPVHRA